MRHMGRHASGSPCQITAWRPGEVNQDSRLNIKLLTIQCVSTQPNVCRVHFSGAIQVYITIKRSVRG